MSKTSWFYICAMAAIIASVGVINGYRAYEKYKLQKEEESFSDFTFQNVPITLGMPQAEPAARPIPYNPQMQQDVFLGDIPLSPEKETQQADLTLQSIFSDYQNDSALQTFNRELAQLTQGEALSLQALSGPRLTAVVQKYPEVEHLIKKHMQNPQFAAVVGQIFANPQYVQSVQVLQGEPAAAGAAENNNF